MCTKEKGLGPINYKLSDKKIVYKSESLCIIEFKSSVSNNGKLIKSAFEYFVSRGYKSPYRIKEGRFERKVIHEIRRGRSYMYVHKEELKYLYN